jgi:hypothetical protein
MENFTEKREEGTPRMGVVERLFSGEKGLRPHLMHRLGQVSDPRARFKLAR